MRSADLGKCAITHDEMFVAAERRIRHHWHIVLLAPGQNVALYLPPVETVRDLIGCATMTVWHTEQIFHLAAVEVGYAPGANLPRGAQLLESGYNAG